ncbi:MAG: TRAP transporter small permease [Pseudomonadota bacterium]
MTGARTGLRRALDALYLAGGIVAAGFLLAMLGVIVAQMAARWFAFSFPGSAAYAGYCMAAASFLALPYALNAGAHIRVGLFLTALGRHRRWGELWCLAIGAGLATYFAWYAVRGVRFSLQFNDISQDQDATPLWIPQSAMVVGTILLAICLWDNLIRLALTGRDNIAPEQLPETIATSEEPRHG